MPTCDKRRQQQQDWRPNWPKWLLDSMSLVLNMPVSPPPLPPPPLQQPLAAENVSLENQLLEAKSTCLRQEKVSAAASKLEAQLANVAARFNESGAEYVCLLPPPSPPPLTPRSPLLLRMYL
jgi:hypothetical protein